MKEFFRYSDGSFDGTKFAGMILWAVVIVFGLAALAGCGTFKTAKYTFNQGMPAAAPAADPAIRGIASTGLSAGGGAGNTIIIIEATEQDSEADGALSTQGAMAATGAIKEAVARLTTDLSNKDSNNPQTTTTTTTVVEPVKPIDPVEPVKPVDPVDPGTGTVIEED